MDNDTKEMARRYYGHGCWAARYWFIGPEQGQSREENNDLERRVNAWHDLGGGELNDCRDFHCRIGEKRWHRESPQLQWTWRPLMLLLMAFLRKPPDRESLRKYQRDEWGKSGGETCVIELSGLPASSLKVERDRECFREERIKVIRERIHSVKPTWVVMYGLKQKKDWIAITEREFPSDNMLLLGPTIIALTPHPVSCKWTNDKWKELAERLHHPG